MKIFDVKSAAALYIKNEKYLSELKNCEVGHFQVNSCITSHHIGSITQTI